jgi:hypothetical protein
MWSKREDPSRHNRFFTAIDCRIFRIVSQNRPRFALLTMAMQILSWKAHRIPETGAARKVERI